MEKFDVGLLLLPGPLMVLVAAGFIVGWKLRSHTRWRWFWAGAGIWAVGVALKLLWSLLFSGPLLAGLESSLSHGAYLVLGAVYVGLLTGVFEIGATLAAARIWRAMASNANRAVAVGVGAGGFEAALVGVASLVAVLVAMSSLPGSEQARSAMASSVAVTGAAWLVGPVERVIAILCHVSSRTLVLLGVAKRRWAFFWYGFLVMTAIDSVAAFAHISGMLGRVSVWWIELAIAPVAIASVLIVGWCLRTWPADAAPTPAM